MTNVLPSSPTVLQSVPPRRHREIAPSAGTTRIPRAVLMRLMSPRGMEPTARPMRSPQSDHSRVVADYSPICTRCLCGATERLAEAVLPDRSTTSSTLCVSLHRVLQDVSKKPVTGFACETPTDTRRPCSRASAADASPDGERWRWPPRRTPRTAQSVTAARSRAHACDRDFPRRR